LKRKKGESVTSEAVKDDCVYRVRSGIGDLYLKFAGDAYINEVIFTQRLAECGIPNIPEYIVFDTDRNLFVMRGMDGHDLSENTEMGADELVKLAKALAETQKYSIPYAGSAGFYGYDYRIGATADDLANYPEEACGMLAGTEYEVSAEGKRRLDVNTECVIKLLKSIDGTGIPDTVHNSDMAAYNVRDTGNGYIFFDWAWGGVAHPFFGASRLFHTVRKCISPNVRDAKGIAAEAYLREWEGYCGYDELIRVYGAVDRLLGFNVMFYLKYVRTRALHRKIKDAGRPPTAGGKGAGGKI
jgi:hypothetical protein